MLKETLCLVFLWSLVDLGLSTGCSSFFCRRSRRASNLEGADPGKPLFLSPYIERGNIEEGELSALIVHGSKVVRLNTGIFPLHLYFRLQHKCLSSFVFWSFEGSEMSKQ